MYGKSIPGREVTNEKVQRVSEPGCPKKEGDQFLGKLNG
jgi:hypothetical protein